MKYVYAKSGNKFELSQFIVETERERQIALANGYVEISDEDYDKLVNHEMCWDNEKLVSYTKTAEDIENERQEFEHNETLRRIFKLKAELVKVMEDIQQEQLGIVRDDYAEKRVRAAELINELRVLEGKEPRAVNL